MRRSIASSRRPPVWADDGLLASVKRTVPVSVGLHVALFAGIALGQRLTAPFPIQPPVYEVVLVGPVRKGTPGGGSPRAAPVPPSKAAATPPPTIGKQPARDALAAPPDLSARTAALDRLARERALKNAAERASADAATPAPSPTAVADSASGTAGAGDAGVDYGTPDGIPGFATYEQQLQAIVDQHWLRPDWIRSDRPLQCTIRIRIGFDGALASWEMERPSGDPAFDVSALAALQRSSPLPPPPLDAKLYLARVGVPIRFNSAKLQAGGGP